jgi:methylthioribose-1-phosphate isomerase
MVPTVAWDDGVVVMIDQRRLPAEQVMLRCRDHHEVAEAIREMAIRGAPAIGVAAAFALAQGARNSRAEGRELRAEWSDICSELAGTRPTAVNLFWAIERMRQRFDALAGQGGSALREALVAEALTIQQDDLAACRRMGDLGADLLPSESRILTHCNAGALATAGYGTALGVVRSAARAGKVRAVFADETRPWLQGARLTVWELMQDGIQATLIAEGAAGHLMAQGEINAVVVGADRIAANGDVANKIGTYGVAVLAKEHGLPFYVAAPVSTLDLSTPSGKDIPIEERPAHEVTHSRRSAGGSGGDAGEEPGLRRHAEQVRDRDRLRARRRPPAVRREPRPAGRVVRRRAAVLTLALATLVATGLGAADWPRFRGPNGAGVADGPALPASLDPAARSGRWRAAGYSSPILSGDRLYLTAFEGDDLLVLCLSRADGRELWRRKAPRPRVEKVDKRNTPASPSAAVDADRVVVFFADFGLVAYDHAGRSSGARRSGRSTTSTAWAPRRCWRRPGAALLRPVAGLVRRRVRREDRAASAGARRARRRSPATRRRSSSRARERPTR